MLEQYTKKAIQAHNWLSHFPERAGQRLVKDYGEQLEEDIKFLTDNGIDDLTIDSYKDRYENLFSSWLNAKSNCFSSFITGGSNFPVRRHEKTQRSEERHYEIFQEWRTRAKQAIIRKSQPVKTFVSEIERYKIDLENMKKNHELMKAGNIAIKKANKNGEDISQYLINTFNIAPHMIEFTMKFGFGLANNNANMKRVEERIKDMEQKESLLSECPITKYTFEGGLMVVNYEVDRIQVFFNTRPTRDELTQWKEKGLNSYNWSPSANAWQRKITANAMYSVKRMLPQLTKIN
ncbi:MAG: hypothetical protein ABI091_26940 [Ferruginibacter sp.]